MESKFLSWRKTGFILFLAIQILSRVQAQDSNSNTREESIIDDLSNLDPCANNMTISGEKNCVVPGVEYTYKIENVNGSNVSKNCGSCVQYKITGGSIVAAGYKRYSAQGLTSINAGDAWVSAGSGEKFPTITVVWYDISEAPTITGIVDRIFCNRISRTDYITLNPALPTTVQKLYPKATNPTCKSGAFSYSISSLSSKGATYTWKVPAGWKIDGAPATTPNVKVVDLWNTSITGVANGWVDGGAINGGDVTLTIKNGNCSSQTYVIATVPSQLGPSVNLAKSYNLCGGADLVLEPAGGVTNNLKYTWNIWTNYCQTMDCPKNKISDKQLSGQQTVSVEVKDLTTGCISKAGTIVYPFNASEGASGWEATKIFTQKDKQVQVKDNNVSLLTDVKGNAYYTAADGLIYTYRYTNADPNYPWENYAINSGAPLSNGQMAYDVRNNVAKIYYIGEDQKAYMISSDYEGKSWSVANVVSTATGLVKVIVDESGNPFFISGIGIIYNTLGIPVNSQNLAVSSQVTAAKGRVYFAHKDTKKITCFTYAGVPETVNVEEYLSKVLNTSVLDYDFAGNIYYTATNGGMVKVKPQGTAPVAVSMNNIAGNIYSGGKFSVNKSSQVIYFGGATNVTDDYSVDIYQLVDNAGVGTPFVTRRLTEESYEFNTSLGNYGAVAFRSPTVFYISTDKHVRFIYYNTSSTCQPSVLRQEEVAAHDPEEDLKTVKGESLQSVLLLYPNPASDYVKVKITDTDESLMAVKFTDLNGQPVFDASPEELLNGQLSINSLQKGVYFVHAFTADKNYPVQKLIIR